MVTGDLVIDLALEEAAVEASTDTAALPEAPDDAAEHVLMPSHKGDSLASVSPAAPSAALAVALASTWLPTQATRRAGPIYERPPRSSPVPFPLPLRIQTHIAGSPGLFRRHHDGNSCLLPMEVCDVLCISPPTRASGLHSLPLHLRESHRLGPRDHCPYGHSTRTGKGRGPLPSLTWKSMD